MEKKSHDLFSFQDRQRRLRPRRRRRLHPVGVIILFFLSLSKNYA